MFRIRMGEWNSADYSGVFETLEDARARFKEGPRRMDGSKFSAGYSGLPASEYYIQAAEDKDGKRFPVVVLTRAERQRLRRASPEAKAKEAQASRRSYWKRKEGVGNVSQTHNPATCSTCIDLNAKHSLGLALDG